MSQAQDKTRDTIVSLNPGQWMTRQQLALHLDISTRTVSRRVAAGLVERIEGVAGPLYRHVSHDNRRDTPVWPGLEPGHCETPAGHLRDTARHLRDTAGQDQLALLTQRLAESQRQCELLQARLQHALDTIDQAELAWSTMLHQLELARAEVAVARLHLKLQATTAPDSCP